MTPKPSSPLCPHNDSFFTVGVQLLSYFQTSFKVIVLCELLRRETGREGGRDTECYGSVWLFSDVVFL